MKHFFQFLNRMYNRKGHCVKYYLQVSTFSFSIYKEGNISKNLTTFHPGQSLFNSEVYDHYMIERKFREQVTRDILNKLKELES